MLEKGSQGGRTWLEQLYDVLLVLAEEGTVPGDSAGHSHLWDAVPL